MLSMINNKSLVSSKCLQPSELFLCFLTPVSAVQEWNYANHWTSQHRQVSIKRRGLARTKKIVRMYLTIGKLKKRALIIPPARAPAFPKYADSLDNKKSIKTSYEPEEAKCLLLMLSLINLHFSWIDHLRSLESDMLVILQVSS